MSKKSKIVTRFASLDVFKCDVVLVVCEPEHLEHAASKFLTPTRLAKFKEMLPKDLLGSESREGSNYPIMGGGSLIWCRPSAKPHVLVHEIAHAVFCALRASDTPLSEDTEEVYAYSFECLYKQLLESTPKKLKA